MENMCEMEIDNANNVARFFNHAMKVEPLKLPPRKSEDEICCIWEYKIEE
ncbi:hypothetical protein ACFLX5_05855 [Chloroflexota bacterium]